MTQPKPTRDDLQRAADILRKDAVPVPWPASRPQPQVHLPRRLPRDGALRPPAFSRNLQRLRFILQQAPDVEVSLDEHSWRWTAAVPSSDGDDDKVVTGDHLGELIPSLQRALEDRDAMKRAAIQSQLAVLRSMWGEWFWIGWDGDWWFERRDGKGGR